jgi:16S rRNA (guanine527-N7)-methyltransferase
VDELVEILDRGANTLWGLELNEIQLSQFERYAEMLVEWNATRMNLTRLTTPSEIAVKHFLDSLAVLTVTKIKIGARMIDVGTGAGLPGLALKIARPDLILTLLDSTAKKLTFCRAVADELGLTDVTILHARAEQAGRELGHATAYDVALARAVAPLETLLPWCAPFVKPGGLLVALKGVSVDEEMETARPMARRLGLSLSPPIRVIFPESEESLQRRIVLARKQGRR